MNVKKLLALLLASVMVAVMFTACGASEMAADSYYSYNQGGGVEEAPAEAAPMEEAWVEEEYIGDESGISSTSENTAALPEGQKIITTLDIYAQTENMDPLLESINAKIAQLGGYMEAQEIYNGSSYNDSYRYRNAYLTIRIPADQLDGFVAMVKENANVVRQNTSTENVTLTYVGIQSRITALETEQARLLELLEQAENMEDLLLIEARLTEVQAELENYTSQMRVLDNKINYSTIYLELEEVKEYTPVEDEPDTVWQRIGKGLKRNLKNIGEGFVDFFVWIVVVLPYLAIIGVIAVVVILIVKKAKKKSKKNEPPKPEKPTE